MYQYLICINFYFVKAIGPHVKQNELNQNQFNWQEHIVNFHILRIKSFIWNVVLQQNENSQCSIATTSNHKS